MMSHGASKPSFSTIVAAGANGSLPHAVPGEYRLRRGDMITMDFGARYGNYCADMTRTVALGQPSDEMKKVYGIVLDAQKMAQDAVAAGKLCRDIDAIARNYIYSHGYEGRFGHGLGHSVGIDIHEDPRFNQVSTAVLKACLLYTSGRGTQELVYNDLPFARSDTVLLPHGKAVAGQPWQTTQEGNLCLVSDVPALGWRTIETCDAPDAPAETRADQALETSFVRIELDGTGAFTRLYDKRLKRELLLPGARGNRLMAFEDRPASWDSWNIDMYYRCV